MTVSKRAGDEGPEPLTCADDEEINRIPMVRLVKTKIGCRQLAWSKLMKGPFSRVQFRLIQPNALGPECLSF